MTPRLHQVKISTMGYFLNGKDQFGIKVVCPLIGASRCTVQTDGDKISETCLCHIKNSDIAPCDFFSASPCANTPFFPELGMQWRNLINRQAQACPQRTCR